MSSNEINSLLFADDQVANRHSSGSRKSACNRAISLKDAQRLVRFFASRNGWEDIPNIDKFDHLHEELLEMSRYLRYKDRNERIEIVKSRKEVFVDGIGDLLFGLCRLANQLDVDIEEAFDHAQIEILSKYQSRTAEFKLIQTPESEK